MILRRQALTSSQSMRRHASILTEQSRQLKEKGILAGVALNPATPLSAIEYVLPKVDMVLIMTVNPGLEDKSLFRTL